MYIALTTLAGYARPNGSSCEHRHRADVAYNTKDFRLYTLVVLRWQVAVGPERSIGCAVDRVIFVRAVAGGVDGSATGRDSRGLMELARSPV
jgi:hypothetical protein